MNVELELKEEKIQEIKERIENLYKLLQFVVALATVIVIFFSIRDFVLRWKEGQRQRGIDEIVREMMRLQNAAIGQQVAFGKLQLAAAEKDPTKQFEPVERVSDVINVVQQTLAFRLQQEQKVADAIQEIEKIRAERERVKKQKFEHALAIREQLKKLSRMEFAAMTTEQYRRAIGLHGLVDDLGEALNEEAINKRGPIISGDLLYFCGVVAYYDNDVVSARDYLERAVQCRAANHEALVASDVEYRTRFAFTHYYRALIQKNWGELSEALHEIEQCAKTLGKKEGEFLTPVTRSEIRSYMVGDERRCREELDELLRQVGDFESALKSQAKGLDANQTRLRNRMLLLLGNTHFVLGEYQEALEKYNLAIGFSQDDYYALASAAQCYQALGLESGEEHLKRCLDAIERAGGLARKRERAVRAVLAVIAANAAKVCGDKVRYDVYAREARDMLSGNLVVDSMSPKFFSPSTKRLVSSSELLKELK